ncbi:methionine ABC transporter permease [Agromyces seonyuensis]|uniref:ABC transporter permease subunit n=1 Tax=Agromyces seonyuensis TaxID=2662446 RepID=A0A6I4NYZ3_9MICO|nr:ABC transporter permease subunit [Agromyces seonyuensis]MWB99526.1 ABC transporter permease subunit [Agromyces seonyuensis]
MPETDLSTLLPKIWDAFLETLIMVTGAFVAAAVLGVLLGLVVYATRPGNLLANSAVFNAINAVINVVRPVPFIIVAVALIPVTRLVMGTSIGPIAAIFPLALVASVAIARIAESNLVAVDPGVIEAGAAMGARPWRVLFTIVIPEALGPLTLGLTYIFVALVDATAVAGVIGGGGLGDLAMTYGYQRFDWVTMFIVIAVLITIVQLAQFAGNRVARLVLHEGR